MSAADRAISRRDFLGTAALLAGAAGRPAADQGRSTPERRLVIDCTDLYHPPQDPGDNVDLIAAYALPEVELLAVILDITERYRHDFARDPGVIPVAQLNAIFDRTVPCAPTPFSAMRHPYDEGRDAPGWQQEGIDLLLDTLRAARAKVDIVSFGSAKPVALAYNREPELMLEQTRLVHLCAGSSEPGFIEWNVALDPYAFIRVLRSRLPVAVYPCATADGPFAYGPHNCFWLLENLEFIRDMDPRLRQYLLYAFSNAQRADFLRYLDEAPDPGLLDAVCARPHNVWETSVWIAVSDRRLVQRAGGACEIIPSGDVRRDDEVLPNKLVPCTLEVDDTGVFHWERCEGPSRVLMYDRGDPLENERALRQAMPALYRSFSPSATA